MVPSRILHPNIQLVDITDQFHDSAKQLQPGQLVKDEHFTLFEAVGALEIGDPKMDSGCLEEGEDLEDDFDFTKPLSTGQVLWLMDELMCREVAWHQGYPLSQTLFTSLHVDRLLWPEPKQLSEAQFIRPATQDDSDSLQELFRVYCLGLLKCCDLVHTSIINQHYYEEEDFATQLFNRELLHAFPPEDILPLMLCARKDFAEAAEDTPMKSALLGRLELRIGLLNLLTSGVDGVQPRSKEITSPLADLHAVDKSTVLFEPLPDAFSVKIQRRLASSVPPRPMVAVKQFESITFLRQMLNDIGSAFDMFNISHSSDLLTAYRVFMAQKPEPSVYVRALLQSFLNLDDTVLGQRTTKDFTIADLKSLVLPASVLLDTANDAVENPVDPRFRIASQISQFVYKVSPLFINQYRSFCQNRCRLRRILCHAVIEMDNIQADAEEIDGYLQTLINEKPISFPAGDAPTYAYPLSSWIYHYKLIQLQDVVHLGFELSVYATHEYAGMYWYLSNLTSLHLAHLERISYFASSSSSHAPSGTAHDAQRAEIQDALGLLYRHFSRLKATDTLASALHRVYVVLQRHGHCAQLTPAYSSDELRFDLRMRPFQNLSIPEPLTFEEMQNATSLRALSDREMLDQAARLALTARKSWEEILKRGWNFRPLRRLAEDGSVGSGNAASVIEREWTRDVRGCMKACIGTSITITALTRALDEGSKTKGQEGEKIGALKVSIPGPEDADRFHRWWAVPKIAK